jgi:surfeit locus 1 family protein
MAFTFKPLPVMTLLSVPALALLLLLGSWQWDRFVTKRDAPPPAEQAVVPLDARVLETAVAAAGEPERRVSVTARGVWLPGTVRVYAVLDGKPGARLFSPLRTRAGILLVDRGWVPESLPSVDATGEQELAGVLRAGAPSNSFTPPNDAAAGAWYWPDVPMLARQLAVASASPSLYLAPFQVDPLAIGTATANPWSEAGGVDRIPAERHLGYALTWWGLASTLVGVWFVFHVRQGRIRWRAG